MELLQYAQRIHVAEDPAIPKGSKALGPVAGTACGQSSAFSHRETMKDAKDRLKVQAARLSANAVVGVHCSNRGMDMKKRCHALLRCVGEALIVPFGTTWASAPETTPASSKPPSPSNLPQGALVALTPCENKSPGGVSTTAIEDIVSTASYERWGTNASIMSSADLNSMLGFERAKDLVGCDDVTCAAEIGGALGATHILSCRMSKLGAKKILTLGLIDLVAQKVVGRAQETFSRPEQLPALVRQAVGRL